jgi:hypothetical protein
MRRWQGSSEDPMIETEERLGATGRRAHPGSVRAGWRQPDHDDAEDRKHTV